jgi:acyl dehydratase
LETFRGQRLGPYLSHNAVSATQIWQWCSAMGDRNPLYWPGEGQVAPPAMMQMWTMRDFNDRYAPGSTSCHPYRVFDDMAAMGYPANVAVSYDLSFSRYLRIGERAKHYTTMETISDRKTTTLGIGYFVTERVEYQTLDDDPFAEARITYFQYMPAAEAGKRTVQGVRPSRAGSDILGDHAARPDHRDLAVSTLVAGDRLPELAIPITHRLIVSGAIATQDFTPVHHSEPAARAAGMPDIFMNILTTCGLSVRYLTDWAGSGSRIENIKFKLMSSNFPGDVMRLQAEVISVNPAAAGALVEIAFTGQNSLGTHIAGTAILALPNTTG